MIVLHENVLKLSNHCRVEFFSSDMHSVPLPMGSWTVCGGR